MIRFIFIIGILWLVSKLAVIILRSFRRLSQKEPHGPKYGFTKSTPPNPQMDFKDVKDAEFKDLPEKEKV